jgi:L,D-peptidoglycan transpeptidase YkuD (ErfK/YbiS/YcfS/YnhG family)
VTAVADLLVTADGRCAFAGAVHACSVGSGGVRPDKREGDGATPAGAWPLRRLLFRPDRGRPPACVLPLQPIAESDGWCDDPASPDYNRLVHLPSGASHERLWRHDHLYDLVVVVGYNDDPPVAGAGSAIFLHLRREDGGPTAGCVAFARADLEQILSGLDSESRLVVSRG